MPKDLRMWEVHAGGELAELTPARLDLEQRIETCLEQDISIISDDLLVIGRQVGTGFDGATGQYFVGAGVGLDRVAQLLGHESVDTTRIYTTPSEQDLQREVEKIALR